jgi:hypothetical protein
MAAFSDTISVLALTLSTVTAWLTLFRRGIVKMTQPTVIYFGPDSSRSPGEIALPKIYLRTLLFSTSKRGRVVESMHVALARNETHQNFNIWVYGDEKLVRGSGLFIAKTGVATSHHFLAPKDGNDFRFTEGRYKLDVFAHLLGDRKKTRLFSQALDISRDLAASLAERDTGLYFDWGPDSSRYLPHIEKRPPSLEGESFLELLSLEQRRQRREAIARTFESFRLRIQGASNSNAASREQCCALAVEMRKFFEANPEQLRRSENKEFYETYLASALNPSEQYFADEVRFLGFYGDAKSLAPWKDDSD